MKIKIKKRSLVFIVSIFVAIFFSACSTNQMMANLYGIDTGYSKYNPELSSKSDYNDYLNTIVVPNNKKTLADEKGHYYFNTLSNKKYIGSMYIAKGSENYLEVLKRGKALFEPIYTYNRKGKIVMDKKATKNMYYKLKKVLPGLLNLKYTYKYNKLFQSHAKKTKYKAERELAKLAKKQASGGGFLDISKFSETMQSQVYNKKFYSEVIKKLGVKVDYLLLNNNIISQYIVKPNLSVYTTNLFNNSNNIKRKFKSKAEKKAWEEYQKAPYYSALQSSIGEYKMKLNSLNLIQSDLNILPIEVFKNIRKSGYDLQKIYIQSTNVNNKLKSYDKSSSNVIFDAINKNIKNYKRDPGEVMLEELAKVKKDYQVKVNKVNSQKAKMFNDKLVTTLKNALRGFKITTSLKDDSL